nr:PREDICTED: fatty-acid amide hydrolase 2-like [Bemisia tabaci]XP_018906353.1 PREDICTED: fatty-acid amide hydrolase 2-like [Bemisia tabaci]
MLVPAKFQYALLGGLKVLTALVWPITKVISYTTSQKKLPPLKNELLLLSAKELARLIRTKKVKSEEVLKAYITRAQEINPVLNFMVEDRFVLALEEARAADTLIASGAKTEAELEAELPLLGVPLSVKESISVKGMSNNAGRTAPFSNVANEDAETVRCLKLAGAIPFIVTNTPELCMNWETTNWATGTTNNPYDTRRTPGGSSGGEAALISSAGSVIGVVSDIGGSSRLPAMFCGIFGHKPTPGIISIDGHMPSARDKQWHKFFSIGGMSRYSEDLPLLLKCMMTDKTLADKLRLDELEPVKNIKFYYMENDGPTIINNDTHIEIKEAMRKVVNYLDVKHGIKAQKVNISMDDAFALALILMARMENIPSVFDREESSALSVPGVSPLEEVKKFFSYLTYKYTISPVLFAMLKKGIDQISKDSVRALYEKKQELTKTFEDLLGGDGVFLYPSFPNVAHFHYQIYYLFPNSSYLALFNVTEMPVTNCMVGVNSQGLPIGIQVAANKFQDRLCLSVARELETAFGGWVQPPCYEPATTTA